jgi:CTP:molybdopterin cytidylyltransferase MocA
VSAAGIILAAGESRRMGFPKALLRYGDETFLDTLIGLFAARCRPVIVVVGANSDRIREGTLRPAMFVTNSDYQSGQTSSMQCGLRAVPAESDSVLFTLVDHPAVAPATVDALLGGRLQTHSLTLGALTGETRPQAGVDRLKPVLPLLRVPRHQGRRGHPIWFCRELMAEFLALPASGAARDIVRAHTGQTEFLDVDDAGILADIDDAAAYGRLTGAPL